MEIARDGQEAVELARSGWYSAILMDMKMPVMNGLDAARAMRAVPALAAVPIIALTANAFDDDRLQCIEAGMNAYLSKPVEASALYASMLEWLSKANAGDAPRALPAGVGAYAGRT